MRHFTPLPPSSPTMSVYATANNRAASSYSSRYADDDLDSDEEEEERHLSEQYGEAGDDSGAARSNKNKRQANTHMTEEDAAAAKEFEEQVRAKKKKKKQTTLEPIHLKSAKGLIYIRRSFPTQIIKYRHPKNAVSSLNSKIAGGSGSSRSAKLAQKIAITSQINAAASYSRSLVSAYHDFARELLPTLAPEDVYLKIEDLGSKKEIKDYLQLMRDEFRKEYLTKIYGKDKAERILNELEYGLRSSALLVEQKQQEQKYDDYDKRANVVPRLGYAVTNDDEEDMEAEYFGTGVTDTHLSTTTTTVATAPMANPYRIATNEVNASLNDETTSSSSLIQEVAVESNDDLAAPTVHMSRIYMDGDDDDDDDEEEEATFEEDDTVTTTAKTVIGVLDTEIGEGNDLDEVATVPVIEMDGAVLPGKGIIPTLEQKVFELNDDLAASTCDDMNMPLTDMLEKDKDEDDEATFEDDDTVTVTKNPFEKEEEEEEEEEEATVPEVADIDIDARRPRGNVMDCAVLPNEDIDMQVDNENKKLELTQTIVDYGKTQETLTLLMESQFDDYSQDDPFSQVDGDKDMANMLVVVAPTQTDMNVNDNGSQQSQQNDGFSQTQNSRFSQTQGVMFEEDVSDINNVDEDEGTNTCFELGQSETQEY